MQDTGIHTPNVLCAATSNCNNLCHFEGTSCIRDFLTWLRELALDFQANDPFKFLAENLAGTFQEENVGFAVGQESNPCE